jgi:hypothetical protein
MSMCRLELHGYNRLLKAATQEKLCKRRRNVDGRLDASGRCELPPNATFEAHLMRDCFTPAECANYLTHVGLASLKQMRSSPIRSSARLGKLW